MNETTDPRALKTLSNTIYSFIDDTGNKCDWHINGLLGFGASGVVYDISNPKFPGKHYALKEYFPLSLSQHVERKGTEFIIDKNILEKWNSGLENFDREIDVQTILPGSNTEYGNYFMYATGNFKANKTSYIILDTDYCLTLDDYINVVSSLIDNDKKDFSFIKEVLKYHIDICTAVSYLHTNKFLHLDISPSNIMINRKTHSARLSDFASVIQYDAKEGFNKSVCCLSYTNAFSPIEQKSASLGNRKFAISYATDVYSICAVLYKCLFNKTYNPIKGIPEYRGKGIDDIPLCPFLREDATKEIFQLLNDGLCGVEYRTQSTENLKQRLNHIISMIENQEEKEKLVEKLVKFKLAPSISLAIGYYENFLQDTIYEILKLTTITVNEKKYDVSQCKKELQILIPKDVSCDWKTITEDYYKQQHLIKFALGGLRDIGIILDYSALVRENTLRFIDIPQTLRSSFKAIEFIAENDNTYDAQEITLSREKETQSFINAIATMAKNDAIVDSILCIKRIPN